MKFYPFPLKADLGKIKGFFTGLGLQAGISLIWPPL